MARKKRAQHLVPQWPVQDIPYRLTPRKPSAAGAKRIVAMERCPAPDKEMARWLSDPDEAVVLAALRRFGNEFLSSYSAGRPATETGKRLSRVALERILSSAREEGVLWTPALDALLSVMAPHQEHLRTVGEQLLGPLKQWVSEQSDPSRYRALILDGKSHRLLSLISHAVPDVEDEVVDHALSSLGSALLWADAPGLKEEQSHRLLDWGIRHWRGLPLRETTRESEWYGRTPRHIASSHLRRFTLTPEQRAELLDIVAEERVGSIELADALLSYDSGLSSADLDRLWFATRHYRGAERLIAHPGLSLEQAHRLLEKYPSSGVYRALARRPEFLADERIQGQLLKQRGVKIMDALFRELPPGPRLREFLPRYLSARPKEAAAALLDEGFARVRLQDITLEDLLPVLEHESQAVRLLGIQLVSRIKDLDAQYAAEAPARSTADLGPPAFAPPPRSR
jgi:hypothetical protein